MSTTITGLPNATTPLSGTERVPMDQSGTTKDASTQDIANLAPGTNLTYDAATQLLSSSTGTDVTLPLVSPTAAGLMAAGDKARIDQLGADDSPSFTGLTITGTAAVTIPHIHGDLAGAVYIHVKNTTANTLAKGSPVYPTGTVGDTTTLEVAGADSSNPNLLPAVGLLADALAPNASGHAVIAGELTGLNTAGYAIGDALYVASGGGLTAIRPTTGTIQQVAIVGRVNSGTGSVTVTISTEISPNWDTAYSQRLRWDGGATGLNAAAGRASLELAAVASTGAYGDLSGRPTLGTAAAANTGTGAGNVVVLDGSARLPAVDGSQLTGLSSAPVTSVAGRTGAIVLAVGDVANAVATNDARLSDARTPLAHNQAWSTITETPTTLAGYGIIDAVSATATRAANLLLAGPASGAAAAPTFRALTAADLPATTVAAGSYGSGSSVAAFTVDAQGRLTAASNITISLAAAAISDSTSTGRAVLTAFDAAAARNAISAETAGAAAAAQAAAVQRSNHTGTQLAATISDFASAVAALGTTVGNALRSLANPSAVSFLRINADNTVTARSVPEMRGDLGLTIGTAAGNVVALDGSARLPAVDGSLLTNLPGVSSPDVYRAGFYVPTSTAPVQTGQAVAQNTIWYYPFRVLRPVRITGSQIRVVTALTGGQFQVAIYGSSGRVPTGNPLTTSGDQTFGSATLVSGPMTSAWLYPNQIYFRALNVTGGSTGTFIAPSFSVPEFSSLIGVTTSSASASALNYELSLAWTYGTWPDMTSRTPSETSFTRAMFHFLASELG